MLGKAKDALEDAAESVQSAAREYGEKVISAASEGARLASEAAKEGSQRLKESIYNPVFPEDYAAVDYDRPKMIIIVDEDERKGIDICEGSIGWFSKEAGLEVLHLYEEAVPFSGLSFFPRPMCDSVYYVDPFDSNRYVSLDSYFDELQKDKMTELRSIARSLGAKKCTLESFEKAKCITVRKGKLGGRLKKEGVDFDPEGSGELTQEDSASSQQKILFSQTFEGDARPRVPQLRWYAYDQEIKFLIDSRIGEDGENSTSRYAIEIDSASSSTMKTALAAKIDVALKKLGASCNFSLEGEALSESRRKLRFEVEF